MPGPVLRQCSICKKFHASYIVEDPVLGLCYQCSNCWKSSQSPKPTDAPEQAGDYEKPEAKEVIIYTDGACEPNPGPGGYGIVLIFGAARKEVSGGFRLTTNNRMEIYAAIQGLELLKEPCRVSLYSDSQYLVKSMLEGWVQKWKKKNWWRTSKERAINIDLWEKMLVLCEKHQVEFVWVRGHIGNRENEVCDKLSYAALKNLGLPADEGYENKPEPMKPEPITQEGQLCRKCATPVVKRKSKKFSVYLYCPTCHAQYPLEKPPQAKNLSMF